MLATGVARDPVDLLDRHEDPVPSREAELEVVALLAGGAPAEHLLVAGDAVVDVHDHVAGGEALEEVARDDASHRLRPPNADAAEQLAIRDDRQAVRATLEAAVEAALDEGDRPARRRLADPVDDAHGVARLAEELREPRRLRRREHDASAPAHPLLDAVDEPLRATRRQDGPAP